MVNSTNITDLHFEYQTWLRDLSFEKLEFVTFQKKLEQFTPDYSNEYAMKRVDFFQNNFLRHNEVIDILKHVVHIHEIKLSNWEENYEINVEDKIFNDHLMIRGKVETQQHLFKDLKFDFIRFVTSME